MNIVQKIAFLFFILIFGSCQNGQQVDTTQVEVESVEVEDIPNEADDDSREAWQKPNLIMDKMGDLENRVVADIGAGTGYFSFRMLSTAKKVIAIEIENDLIELMKNLAFSLSDNNKEKFETRLADPDNPKLTPSEVDDILIVNVVGYFEDRLDYFRKCYTSLESNGRIHIVDYKVRKLPIEAPDYSNRVYIHLIEEELEAAGFTDITTDDTSLDYQYIVQATKVQ